MVSQRNKKQKMDVLNKEIMSFQGSLREKLSLQIDTVAKSISKSHQLQDEEIQTLKRKVKDQSVHIDQLKDKIAQYENRERKLQFLVVMERKKVLLLKKEIHILKNISDQDLLKVSKEIDHLINLEQENTIKGNKHNVQNQEYVERDEDEIIENVEKELDSTTEDVYDETVEDDYEETVEDDRMRTEEENEYTNEDEVDNITNGRYDDFSDDEHEQTDVDDPSVVQAENETLEEAAEEFDSNEVTYSKEPETSRISVKQERIEIENNVDSTIDNAVNDDLEQHENDEQNEFSSSNKSHDDMSLDTLLENVSSILEF